ncbi:PaaI family thioesterase [Conexibacter sp. W3-3-2]|uniref:PaaI family thioesterase n=1 Tax=Conexibacter sp. W3-3-2 TaxID=2675227 RepID=UPI0018A8BAE1|nr:PaaI family thioesterase [Conexibacter sp. W3-3-2]
MTPDTFSERYNPAIAQTMIELGNAMPGLAQYLGIELVEFGPGTLLARAQLGENLLTPSGNVHGGVLAGIMDHITGAVIYPLMPDGHWGATTELKLNYIAPVQAGTVDAHASVLAMTKRSAVVRGELQVQDRLVCAGQGTITIVAPRTP